MKKSLLTLGIALFAFTGVFAQETQTETEELNEDVETQEMEDPTIDEYPATEGEMQGKTEVTFEELPLAVQESVTAAGLDEISIVEAYRVEAEGDMGTTEAKYEIHADKDGEAKVWTFDESGEKIKKDKDKKDKNKDY